MRPTKHQLSLIRCVTCGSLPTGDYPVVRRLGDERPPPTVDDRRRYSCGPHAPVLEVNPEFASSGLEADTVGAPT